MAGHVFVTCLSTSGARFFSPSGIVSVASHVAGAPAKVLGENTMTKFIASVSHCTSRKLAIFAVMLRPSTLTVTPVAKLQAKLLAFAPGKETSGSPP